MKTICTILLVCLTFLSNAQTLEYNRTIDTLLAVTIPGGTSFNITNLQIIGNYIAAPSNKVWKVQSVIIMPVAERDINSNPILIANSSGIDDFADIGARIAFMLKNNGLENSLFSEAIPAGSGGANQGSNMISSPIWINNSELGIAFTHTHSVPSTNSPYLNPNWGSGSYTGYVHLSILEFNTN
jgi:hypothetical protein